MPLCRIVKSIVGWPRRKGKPKMTCHNCKIECRKFGRTRKGQQRYRCCQCYKTYSDPRDEHLGGMYTAPEKVEGVINLLVEGCSIRSIRRLTGIDQNTIMKILVLAGDRCQRLLESSAEKCACPMFNVMKSGASWVARRSITKLAIPSLVTPSASLLSSGRVNSC